MSVTAEVDNGWLLAKQDQGVPADPPVMAALPLESDQASMEKYRLGFDADSLGIVGFDNTITVGEGIPLGDATPTGQSYMLCEHWGGAWCDAEKVPPDDSDGIPPGTGDDYMCWAAAASNVLDWTGWGDISGMTTSDQMFRYFQNHWTDDGGLMGYGWDWWFDGTNPSQGWLGWSQVDVAGGGFYRSENINNYYHSSEGSSTAMASINSYLHAGYGVSLGVFGPGGHAITCWGYNYNPSNSSDYYGIWVTDSDDSKSLTSAPDLLRYYTVRNTSGRWYLQNFYGSNSWYIDLVEGLAPRDGAPEPPAPTNGEIRGTVWNDKNGNGVWNSGEPGLANKLVYLDTIRNGRWDHGTVHAASTSVPKTISDLTTVSSTLTVSGAATRITDLNITLNITHTWDSDLTAYLVSPSGTQVLLFDGVGSSGDNFANTVLDDEATVSISAGAAPFTGSFKPQGLLSSLDGENPNGVWTLRVADSAAQDVGRLNSWSIDVSAEEPIVRTDASGDFAFSDVAAGTYYVRHNPSAGWLRTTPTSGYRSVTVQNGATVSGINFGDMQTGQMINFANRTLLSYGGSTQDVKGTVTVESGGLALHLTGNRWKAISYPYTVTGNTILEFDFQSSRQGEIHGIGLDTNLLVDQSHLFQVYGTQSYAIRNYRNYSVSAPAVKHYTIPVGQFYTGAMKYLFFANDHDVRSPTGQGIFSNVRVYESVSGIAQSGGVQRGDLNTAWTAALADAVQGLALCRFEPATTESPVLEAALLVEGAPVRAVDAVFSGIRGDLATEARSRLLSDETALSGSSLSQPLEVQSDEHGHLGLRSTDDAAEFGAHTADYEFAWIPATRLDLKVGAAVAG